jgi:MoxR-like ATPase
MDKEKYQPAPELVRVTDLAIALQRPLLLQGEPGSGKTRLAHALAYALGLPLDIAYIKSTSRAQDLLYTYDAVKRLYDSQLGEKMARDARNYIELGPFGRAITRAKFGRRSVVLIDEIDKADLDFPNDLLWELDRMQFDVAETGEAVQAPANLRPILIITHNEEKPLPPAFLRRCVYYYIEFPKEQKEVESILALHGVSDAKLIEKAAELIQRLRDKDLLKKPGLSELVEWALYQQRRGVSAERLEAFPDLEALLKDRTDQERVRRELTT